MPCLHFHCVDFIILKCLIPLLNTLLGEFLSFICYEVCFNNYLIYMSSISLFFDFFYKDIFYLVLLLPYWRHANVRFDFHVWQHADVCFLYFCFDTYGWIFIWMLFFRLDKQNPLFYADIWFNQQMSTIFTCGLISFLYHADVKLNCLYNNHDNVHVWTSNTSTMLR